MHKKIFVPLMLINNNVYTFISGILISLSTNIFTSLCFEKTNIHDSWFMYLASFIFLVTSALCMYIAAKLSKFQNYIIEKHVVDYERKISIVLDATKEEHSKWRIVYVCTVLMTGIGAFLLVFNFI